MIKKNHLDYFQPKLFLQLQNETPYIIMYVMS